MSQKKKRISKPSYLIGNNIIALFAFLNSKYFFYDLCVCSAFFNPFKNLTKRLLKNRFKDVKRTFEKRLLILSSCEFCGTV